jgi:hypothetical protein
MTPPNESHRPGCPALGGYGTSDRDCICKPKPDAEAALARANACINAFNRYFDDDDKTLLDDIRREHAEAIKDAAIDAALTGEAKGESV